MKNFCLLLLTALSLLLYSCGDTESLVDAELIGTSIEDGATGVSVQTDRIVLEFSEAMGMGYSFTSAFASTEYEWTSDTEFTIYFTRYLNYDTTYELVLNPTNPGRAFADVEGNDSPADKTISFTTESAPDLNVKAYSKFRPESDQYLVWAEIENNTDSIITDISAIAITGEGIGGTSVFDADSENYELNPTTDDSHSYIQTTLSGTSSRGDEYSYEFQFDDGSSETVTTSLHYVYDEGPQLSSPVDGANVSTTPTISWQENGFFDLNDASAYCVQVEKTSDNSRIWYKWFYEPASSTSMEFDYDGTATEDMVSGQSYYIVINAYGQSGSWTSNVITVEVP
ncbi:MAG: Ig-like domain-containing protein [Spirochaetales bacterium]|nr:Ig-like domain-containing protein [Spirochaetales bacterium]